MKKINFIIGSILILGAIIGGSYLMNKNKSNPTVTINHQVFFVELAKSQSEQEKGLSGRDHLEADAGMLFIFDKTEIHSFWMKNTLIPLDIIWINKGKIVEITTLDPDTPENTPEYTPENQADYALELNAGTVDQFNIKVGDKVKIKY